jgi:ankyrin repeat protein
MQLLLRRGAALEPRDDAGQTPLHVAVAAFQIEATQHLLGKGADARLVDSSGDTAVHVAVRVAAAKAASLTSAAIRLFDEILTEVTRDNNCINAIGANSETPLYIAASVGALRLIRMVVQHGADPARTDDPVRLRPPLHAAVTRLDTDTSEMLIELGADASIKDMDGRPALLVAMQSERSNNFEVLLRSGTMTVVGVWVE